MLITTEVTVSWHHRNKGHYIDNGYSFTKLGESFVVDVCDLPKGSKVLVEVECDYCGDKIDKSYSNYLENRIKHPSDCCSKNSCLKQKKEVSMLLKHGVTHHMHIEKVKEKIKKTNLAKYGVENVFESELIKEKIAKINIQKYGVENPFASEIVKGKIKETIRKKYGKNYPMQVDSIKEKMYQTKVKNGKTNLRAMFPIINGVAASRPQIELGEYLNGKVNEYMNGKFVDVYLESSNTAIEYDGGGHTLDIKRNRISEEEFYLREKQSEERLLQSVDKFVRITNEQDMVFSCEQISKDIYEFINSDSKSLLIKIS